MHPPMFCRAAGTFEDSSLDNVINFEREFPKEFSSKSNYKQNEELLSFIHMHNVIMGNPIYVEKRFSLMIFANSFKVNHIDILKFFGDKKLKKTN